LPEGYTTSERYVCNMCRKSFISLENFSKSNSYIYSSTGRLPVCKDCLEEIYKHYEMQYRDAKKAIQKICMMFDLYYSDSLFLKSDNGTEAILGSYLKKLNMVQFQNKTFDNTLAEGFVFGDVPAKEKKAPKKSKQEEQPSEENKPNDSDEPKISKANIQRWGYGYEPEDYDLLNQHYKYLKEANPNCDSNQEIFVLDLCYTKMQQMKAVRENRVDDYKKLTESYIKSFQQAGLKTVQEASTSADDCWSAWTSLVSQYTPEEYYRDKTLYKDMDGIGEYYDRHAIRPLSNLEMGTNDRDYEFFVHESGDDDD